MEYKGEERVNIRLKFFLLLAIVIYFYSIIFLEKKQKLQLRYSLIWGIAGIVMFFITLFPDWMVGIIQKIGIIDTNIGLLAIVIFLLMLILMSLSSVVSTLDAQNKKLIQKVALIEYRLRYLEKTNLNKGEKNV